jgi:hypothetical protein
MGYPPAPDTAVGTDSKGAQLMTRTNTRIAIILALILSAVACKEVTTQPMRSVHGSMVPSGLTMEQVRDGILFAGPQRGWVLQDVRDGVIRAEIHRRTHTAVVEISYDESEYSIDYVDSIDLDASDGMIHRTYNRWVTNLDLDIRTELMRISSGQ